MSCKTNNKYLVVRRSLILLLAIMLAVTTMLPNALLAYGDENESNGDTATTATAEVAAQADVTVTAELEAQAATATEKALAGSLKWIYDKNKKTPVAATYGAEWSVFALARGDYRKTLGDDAWKSWANAYLKNLSNTKGVKGKTGTIKLASITDNARVVITLSALGFDAKSWEKRNFVAPLLNTKSIKAQGFNGAVYALIALDSKDYGKDYPKVRSYCLNYILDSQLEGGGWDPWKTGENDPDSTSQALQALAPYYKLLGSGYKKLKLEDAPSYNKISAAVGNALTALGGMQAKDGGMTYFDSTNAMSCAQVITALCSLDINLKTYPGLIKNGKTLLNALLGFYNSSTGAFKMADPDTGKLVDGVMATDQAAYALVAYSRFINSQNPLYDMGDAITPDTPTDNADDGDDTGDGTDPEDDPDGNDSDDADDEDSDDEDADDDDDYDDDDADDEEYYDEEEDSEAELDEELGDEYGDDLDEDGFTDSTTAKDLLIDNPLGNKSSANKVYAVDTTTDDPPIAYIIGTVAAIIAAAAAGSIITLLATRKKKAAAAAPDTAEAGDTAAETSEAPGTDEASSADEV